MRQLKITHSITNRDIKSLDKYLMDMTHLVHHLDKYFHRHYSVQYILYLTVPILPNQSYCCKGELQNNNHGNFLPY